MALNVFNQSHCSLRPLLIMFLPRHDAPKTEKLHNNGITYQCSENHVSVTQGSRSVNHIHAPYLTMNTGKYNNKKSSLNNSNEKINVSLVFVKLISLHPLHSS